ncbi:MAG: 2-hydroxyglutaryl-CoA dehydratase [Erysipelotrichia bacterium]|nr:2-hydroxyglutaryl-CoA dehydratase [Erysipelotrichia bacterium]NCC55077.1 2-hydroxyglutaryl-CoA dehydratase [Erysipelotrichia bacterium]
MQTNRVEFTKEMKKTHKILIPNMLPIHFKMYEDILQSEGYDVELLTSTHHQIIDEGVRNVHNDTCYPALLVIGQMIDALKSGRYDLDHVALIITQTGGGCRASNYINLLRKALASNNMAQIPVISLNFAGLESNSGFKLNARLGVKLIYATIYADMIMWISNQCLPYEKKEGTTKAMIRKWQNEICKQLHSPAFLLVSHNYRNILHDFATIEKLDIKKPKVGIVGEIYMKYAPLGNNNLEAFLIKEGAEPILSGLLDFILYCLENIIMDYQLYHLNKNAKVLAKLGKAYIIRNQKRMIKAIQKHSPFIAMENFDVVKEMANDYISKGVKMGEGWLLTSEMLDLIHSGVNNIICTQPFGCLPNHIVAKGMLRKIKDHYPMSNIVAIDYDPGASAINQENRIKLMLSNAKSNEN